MQKLSDELKEAVTKLAGNWPSIAALGSFAIYLLGYLIVRFHLTVFGIGTDLSVLDERYLFAGAKFLVYLFSTIPVLLFLPAAATVFVLISSAVVHGSSWLLHRLLPNRVRVRAGLTGRVWGGTLAAWSRPWAWLTRAHAETLAFVGVVVSVVLIQFLMRQCFLLSELLVAREPPEPRWLTQILLDETGNSQYYYFTALVAGTLLCLGLLLTIKGSRGGRKAAGALRSLLTVLVCVQCLFLPINYGILVFDKVVPRVISLGGQRELSKCRSECQDGCQEAWLVWEGTDGQTFLVREWSPQGGRRLVTLPLKENKVTEIVGYDPILTTLLLNRRCL